MAYYDIKSFSNPQEKTPLEKKHVPFIQAPTRVKKGEYFDVAIRMGEELDHPMEVGHFIQYVDLYANYYHLGRVGFTPDCKAEATMKVKLEECCTLRAYTLCNLHGQWESAHEITVEE
ncbi:MAG: desulfoferrodoxin [Halanaerobiales bacterium]|nr:desulfoferrodoxin [Halanaerobiales bacterium]